MARARLALSLEQLLREVNSTWPGRSRKSDGWIGDAAHRARSSDHNPDANGWVLALDITNEGVNVQRLVVDVTHHPATWYVISRGWLYSRTHDFVGVPYRGADDHTTHLHVNLRHTAGAIASRRPWLSPRPPAPAGATATTGQEPSAPGGDQQRA